MKSPGSGLSGGKDYLEEEKWEKMGTKTSVVSEFMDKINRRLNRSIFNLDEDQLRVLWLSITLFFTVGGYWLLRSLKDPIISIIDGVDRIPQAKIASLFVVLFLVVVCKCYSCGYLNPTTMWFILCTTLPRLIGGLCT